MDDGFRKVNDEAALRAGRILKNGFDAEAFIVYSIALMNNQKIIQANQGVDDTTVDDSIANLLQSFVRYHNGDRSQLQDVLNEIRQIVSELYHTAEDLDARSQICEFVETLSCFKQ